jgi:hypothetical protein
MHAQGMQVELPVCRHHPFRPVPEFIDPVFAKTHPKRSFSIIEHERLRLLFAKTGSINSGTDMGKMSIAVQETRKIVYD